MLNHNNKPVCLSELGYTLSATHPIVVDISFA